MSKHGIVSAARAWAEYWGTACPDCGPGDYGFMLQQVLNMLAENASRRERTWLVLWAKRVVRWDWRTTADMIARYEVHMVRW